MCQIDVLPGDKGKFRVLLNFCQHGASYSSAAVANHEAMRLKEKMPQATLHLADKDEKDEKKN